MSNAASLKAFLLEEVKKGAEEVITEIPSHLQHIVGQIQTLTRDVLAKIERHLDQVSPNATTEEALKSVCPLILNTLETSIYHVKNGNIPRHIQKSVRRQEQTIRALLVETFFLHLSSAEESELTANLGQRQKRSEEPLVRVAKDDENLYIDACELYADKKFEAAEQSLRPAVARLRSSSSYLPQREEPLLLLYAKVIGALNIDRTLLDQVLQNLSQRRLIKAALFQQISLAIRTGTERARVGQDAVRGHRGYAKRALPGDRKVHANSINALAANNLLNINTPPEDLRKF